ncbi:LOW QUALITY PROTEIN: immediate early response gene 2 protein [Phalacrocorax aristotelis]|uniref:LOW QUALITY PROTEIN: immediate early response gene 2 protein n=1 Tax=Phalacrocorax aristotelis TaxID=126867 RepID=UPI003F4B063E
MEEAQRLLTVSVWKLYRCRLQRGGLRLHRSLQLSLLVRAARHRYLTARSAAGTPPGAAPGDPLCLPTPDRGHPPSAPAGDPRSPSTAGTLRAPRPATPAAPSTEGTPPSRQIPDPRSAQDRGDPPNAPTPDPRSAQGRGHLPTPDSANRDHPQDSPSRYRDPPSAPRLPPPRDPPSAPPATLPPPEPRPQAAPRPPGTPPAARTGRKRRSSGSAGPGPVPVPSKRARLEAEEPPLAPGPPGRCSGPPAAAFGLLVRAVGAC